MLMLKKYLLNACQSLILILACAYLTPAMADILKIELAYVGSTSDTAWLGVKQGLDEANLQGQFLGQEYKLDTFTPGQIENADFSRYLVIFTAVDRDRFLTISMSLPDVPIINLTLNDDDLRTACLGNALHVVPSNRMKADAEEQWLKKTPDSHATAHAWHPDFNKFAARDLNKRFLKNQTVKMDDMAWAGWAAVKMISDTVAREGIADPEKLLQYLKTRLSFDGQKGSNLNFRVTGQLRQLLILVEDDKIVAEAPVRGVAKPPTLDSLGILDCEK